MEDRQLIQLAFEAVKNAYAPYSKFRVGAALVTRDGKVYTGVNIENASYGAACCAERTAVFKAVSEGNKDFEAIAIASDGGEYVYPCGICRQVLSEFGDEKLKIICTMSETDYKVHTLGDLLPEAFRKIPGKKDGGSK